MSTPESSAASQPSEAVGATTSRKGPLLMLGIGALALVVFFFVAFAPKGAPAGGVLPVDPTGFRVPDVTLPGLDDGQPLALASFKGKPLVVNFWASWCTTCIDEAALLGATERKYRSQGVVFIGMDSSDKDASAKAFMAKYGIEYTSLVDSTGAQTPKWGVTGYPETFFIGRDGRIKSKYISAIDAKTLETSIAAILHS